MARNKNKSSPPAVGSPAGQRTRNGGTAKQPEVGTTLSKGQRRHFAAGMRAAKGDKEARNAIRKKENKMRKKAKQESKMFYADLAGSKKSPSPPRSHFVAVGTKFKAAKTPSSKKNKSKKTPPMVIPNTTSSKKSKKKAAKNKSASSTESNPNVQIQLPPKRTSQGRVPWMKNMSTTTNTVSDTNQSNRTNRVRLPTDDSDPVLLERFSQELRAFGEYIRLTPVECTARDALLQQMHSVAVRVFQNSPEIIVKDLELQVFGSYACRQVCTFRSDVDVALWGAVFPKLTKRTKVSTTKHHHQEDEATLLVDPKTVRKEKWKLALAMLDEENLMTPDHTVVKTASKEEEQTGDVAPNGDNVAMKENGDVDPENKGTNESVAEENGDDLPLFVLDRTGIELPGGKDAKEEEESLAKPPTSASVSTQVTVTESESSVEDPTEARAKEEENDSSDDDTADKLTESQQMRDPSKSQASSLPGRSQQSPLSTTSSGSDSDEEEEEDDDDDMAVHFFNQAEPTMDADASDFSRRKVIDGLQRYFRGLRNSDLSRNIQLISRARVPIIKMEANLGVDVDCSIGGMNGADTSLYALKMCQKYQSFAPVVVALKVIMGQQNLDTPFSGGLGSYKLYVLVASHIEKHVELGGRDDPGEIFLSFVFRYGDSVGHHHTHRDARTLLAKDDVVSCSEGGNADLSNVFLIRECRNLFGSLWKRLWGCLRRTGQPSSADTPRVSYLSEVIHTAWLDHSRQTNIASAEDFMKRRKQQSNRQTPWKTPKKQNTSTTVTSAGRTKRDLTEDELIASYRGRPAKKAKAQN